MPQNPHVRRKSEHRHLHESCTSNFGNAARLTESPIAILCFEYIRPYLLGSHNPTNPSTGNDFFVCRERSKIAILSRCIVRSYSILLQSIITDEHLVSVPTTAFHAVQAHRTFARPSVSQPLVSIPSGCSREGIIIDNSAAQGSIISRERKTQKGRLASTGAKVCAKSFYART